MSETITRENGEEAEVFSAEELETQKAEAVENYKEENQDVETLKKELEEKKEELEKLNDKDNNFKKLRDKGKEGEAEKVELEEKIEKLTGEMSDKLDSAISNLAGDKKTDIISSLVGDDEELKKKVEFHYDRIKDEAKTKDEIKAKVQDAYFLATRQEAPTGNYMSSAGAGNVKVKSQVSAEEKELGDKLGITDEDRKKYNK